MNANLFVISLYITVIPSKIFEPDANAVFKAVKNVVAVYLPGVIVNVCVFAALRGHLTTGLMK